MEEHEIIFENYLKNQGLLLTSQRKLIMDCVFNIHEHFDAESLMKKIQVMDKDVSRATVYRTIPLLINAGLIKQSEKIEDKECYEHILGHPRHLHIICNICHKILEVDESNELSQLFSFIAQENEVDMQDYKLTIKGICNECKKTI